MRSVPIYPVCLEEFPLSSPQPATKIRNRLAELKGRRLLAGVSLCLQPPLEEILFRGNCSEQGRLENNMAPLYLSRWCSSLSVLQIAEFPLASVDVSF